MNNNLHQQLLPPPPSICSHCNSDDQLILHNIILAPKSPLIQLCTSCVLLHYHKSICAQCFEPYDANSLTPPPLTTATTTTGNNRLLPCMRCDNWSHLACPRPNVPKSPYICPPCMSANYKYFDYRKGRKNDKNQIIDKDASKQLLGAARIAAVTVAKAAAIAKVEAERRAKEAALARKRAREAIDNVMAMNLKLENAKRKEMSTATTGPKSVSYVPVRLESNGGSNKGDVEIKNVVGRENGDGNGAIVAVPVPVPVVVPPQQGINDSVGVGGGAGGKDGDNAGQPPSK